MEDVTVKVSFLGEIRSVAGCKEMQVSPAEGNTVEGLLKHLCQKLGQSFAARLFDSDGSLYNHVVVFVNGQNIKEAQGLNTTLTDGNVDVMILPVWDGG